MQRMFRVVYLVAAQNWLRRCSATTTEDSSIVYGGFKMNTIPCVPCIPAFTHGIDVRGLEECESSGTSVRQVKKSFVTEEHELSLQKMKSSQMVLEICHRMKCNILGVQYSAGDIQPSITETVKHGETWRDAVVRGVAEEAGIVVTTMSLIRSYRSWRTWHVVLARGDTARPLQKGDDFWKRCKNRKDNNREKVIVLVHGSRATLGNLMTSVTHAMQEDGITGVVSMPTKTVCACLRHLMSDMPESKPKKCIRKKYTYTV